MPFGEVKLIPGVNVERTPTLNEAGFSQSQLIRFKDGLAQKYGGWQRFYPFVVPGVPRDLHAWEDLNQTTHLSIGTTTQLGVITSGVYKDVTPQTLLSDFAPNFSTDGTTATVTIVDPNITNVTTFDSIFFNTPIAVGGLVLSGPYPIASITGTHSYTIMAATASTSIVNNGGAVPVFTTTNNSASVSIAITKHGLVATTGAIQLPIATTGNGVTLQGHYIVTAVTDANDFTVVANNQATASGSFSMNGGNAEILYYINLGPSQPGTGYGLGAYGAGAYGLGGTTSGQTGTEITATDWTSDNWGEILLACPAGGGVYQYDPTGGYTNAGLVATAPTFNDGLFVSSQQQILVCWGSTNPTGIGVLQNPLLVRWSDSGDYTNFTKSNITQAGSDIIPSGSVIRGGAAVQNQNLIWTDLDLWAMNYSGQPFIYGFNMIGAGAGMISRHAAQKLRGNVYWMGPTNFYAYDNNGVHVLPCSVWDFVFQNLNTAFASNVRAIPNTPFNEAGWEFPSLASVSGENDSYVKFNLLEPGAPWDYGALNRAAWIDQTVLGMPVAATSSGLIFQHESSPNNDGGPLVSSFTTGYFYIAEGQEFAFVDRIYPDFKWGTFAGSQNAQVQLTFNVADYPADTPVQFGPYTVTSTTEYVPVRFRGRQMSITVQSGDTGSFWRLGKVRYRYAPAGRR